MDLNQVFQMEQPMKKNILLRYDSTTNSNLGSRNVAPSKKNILTKSKLKMTLPISEPPSSQSKVSHWLNDCSHINFNTYRRPQVSMNGLLQATHESDYEFPLPPPPLDFEVDVSEDDRTVKQNILVRQDFHEKPVIRQSIDSNSSMETNRVSRKLLKIEAPLSPESRKKNELCSYLQLMDLKHPELKNGNIYKNRRSTRVKNLLIMTEKKELESKLRDEAKVKETSCEQNDSLSKKSFQELNMLPECDVVSNTNISQFDLFRPVHVPKHLLNESVDFEDFIKDFVSELTKKEMYIKTKKNIMKKMRKLQLERLKTLRKKKTSTMKRSPKNYIKKKVANFKKTNVKYISPIRSLRSTNKVILRSKVHNLRKQHKNSPVKSSSEKKKQKKIVEVSTGKENHKKNDVELSVKGKHKFNLRNSLKGKTVDSNLIMKSKHKRREPIHKNNLNIREKSEDDIPKTPNLEINKRREAINKNNLKIREKSEDDIPNTPNLEINSPDSKQRNPFKILKYDFEKQKSEEVKADVSLEDGDDFTKIRYNFVKEDDSKTNSSFKSKSEVIDMLMVKLSESEKVHVKVIDEVLMVQNETFENRALVQSNNAELETGSHENVVINLDDDESGMEDGGEMLVEFDGIENGSEGMVDVNRIINSDDDEVDGNGKLDVVCNDRNEGESGDSMEEDEVKSNEIEEEVNDEGKQNKDDDDDNKIEDDVHGGAIENTVDTMDNDDDDVIYIGTVINSEDKEDIEKSTASKPKFCVKTLEDIEKRYSTLIFNSVCADSDDDSSSISEEVLHPYMEKVVSITDSTCSDNEQDYQVNIAISEHNYTRSPGSIPIEYDPVERSSPSSEKGTVNALEVLQEHTLDEIKWIIHGDIVPNKTHDSIEEVVGEVSKTPEKSCDTILNNNEENSHSAMSASVYKLNSCNSISNDSNELEERDLTVQETTNDTCDITELQSSLKPIRNNGSHEDFKGFNNRQSPKLIEFNENNFPKSLNRRNDMKSLHRNLLQNKRKSSKNSDNNKDDFDSAWATEKIEKKSAHTIDVQEKHGEVLDAYYFDYNLIITQDLMISFWTQSALGFMLEAQNMWIPRGSIQRLALDNNCTQKRGKECVLTTENSFAYVELWTKEHKSDKRERPVADVFAVIYFWINRQMGPEKKFLQLENINGFADDVQYVVLKNSAIILVSWRMVRDETTTSIIHCYQLASDFQTVVSIKEMESVEHTISSLHNIEDCDTLVMGCGEKQVTIWNLEHGFIVATIDTSDSLPEPLNLWVKCDRGFLFLLQQCSNNIFKLIAINGINHSWKRLQIYKPPMGFDRFKGVCIEHGILIAFYSNGILCWNVQSGDLIMEELCNDVKYLPSGKHIVTYTSDNSLQVKNALSFLITNYDFSES